MVEAAQTEGVVTMAALAVAEVLVAEPEGMAGLVDHVVAVEGRQEAVEALVEVVQTAELVAAEGARDSGVEASQSLVLPHSMSATRSRR